MSEEMRTFGYLCPKCGKPVMGTRSIFALEASDAEIACECGGSVLRTEYDGRDYRVYVPCGLCSETHMAICPPERMLLAPLPWLVPKPSSFAALSAPRALWKRTCGSW